LLNTREVIPSQLNQKEQKLLARIRYCLVAALLLATLSVGVPCHGVETCSNDIAAIKFLGSVDCYWHPEAQTVLIDTLKKDPREPVRYAAVMAITQQLQRGKVPLNATSGWRKVPDPEIFTQICRIASLQCPLTTAELYQHYQDRQMSEFVKNNQKQGDVCHDCCSTAVIAALMRAASEKNLFDCWIEPSERIRWRAQKALTLCCNTAAANEYINIGPLLEDGTRGIPPPLLGGTPGTTSPDPTPFSPGNTIQQSESGFSGAGFRGDIAGDVPVLGRADSSNRFNIFDNMNATPRSRVWYGYQFVDAQNNAVFTTADTNKLFANLNTPEGRGQFIAFTGYGRQPGRPAVNPNDPGAKEELKRQFLTATGHRSQDILIRPDSSLHRFGFEYAFTTDFSVSMMGQYVVPMNAPDQPNSFSNPSIQLKHVLYRSEDSVWSGVFNIQPQISRPEFGIGEDTTRLSPGLLNYQKLSDELFMQNALGFSFPTESHQITTMDYAIGGGYWLYKDASLEPWFQGPKSENWILGVIPQFEVLGKVVLGDNALPGQFGQNGQQARMADGTVSPVDGSRNIYFPQTYQLFQNSSLIYREPRATVDLTVGMSLILKNNFVQSTAISVPVTGGNARALELILTLNKYF
jgi:hypothetical protein